MKDISRNPYHIEGAGPTLRRSVLAYFDMLGHVDFVRAAYNSSTQAQALTSLHEALTSGRDFLEEKDGVPEINTLLEQTFRKDRYALKAFTDNIVIGWPIGDDAESELGDAFGKLIDFQFTMTLAGFFVRGAIAIGEAYVDDVVVFGDALLEAHHAETTVARDPRIVLTASAIDATKAHLEYYPNRDNAPHVRALLRDADGQWFLNYLEAVLYAEYDHGPYSEQLRQHKAIVEKKLELFKPQPRVWSKYAWVASYHNYFCDLHDHWFDNTYKIELEPLRASPKLILD